MYFPIITHFLIFSQNNEHYLRSIIPKVSYDYKYAVEEVSEISEEDVDKDKDDKQAESSIEKSLEPPQSIIIESLTPKTTPTKSTKLPKAISSSKSTISSGEDILLSKKDDDIPTEPEEAEKSPKESSSLVPSQTVSCYLTFNIEFLKIY